MHEAWSDRMIYIWKGFSQESAAGKGPAMMDLEMPTAASYMSDQMFLLLLQSAR